MNSYFKKKIIIESLKGLFWGACAFSLFFLIEMIGWWFILVIPGYLFLLYLSYNSFTKALFYRD